MAVRHRDGRSKSAAVRKSYRAQHAARPILEPCKWLGTSAVALGIGAALVNGIGVAAADDGTSAGSKSSASPKGATDSSDTGANGHDASGQKRNNSSGTKYRVQATGPAATGADSGSRDKAATGPAASSSAPTSAATSQADPTAPTAGTRRGSTTKPSVPLSAHGTSNPTGSSASATDGAAAGKAGLPRTAATAITATASTSTTTPSSQQPRTPATAVLNPTAVTSTAPTTQTRLAAVATAAAINPSVTAAATPVTSQWIPLLNVVAGFLTVVGANPQGPTAPSSPVGAFLWGLFRQFETAAGAPPPVAGTPTVAPPDPATGKVIGDLGATEQAGLPLTYTVSTKPIYGTATVNSTGGYTYTPVSIARLAASVGGATADTFTVTVSDGLASTTEKINVPISAVADVPTAPVSGFHQVSTAGVVTGTVTSRDLIGLPVTYRAASNPAYGSVTVTSTGAYTYTPTLLAQENASVGGPTTDSFTVTASNGTYSSGAGTISVPITAVADTPSAPTFASQSVSAAGVVTGTLTADDPAGKSLPTTL